MDADLLSITADIVSAHVSNNSVSAADLPALISSTYAALAKTTAPAGVETATRQEPAVSIRASVKEDYIVCLEDGKKLKMLKRYLMTNCQMTPDDYRAKWNLPRDYPMVAPAYAEQRRTLAHTIGLGRKKTEVATKTKTTKAKPAKVAEVAKAAPKMRGRPAKPKAETPAVAAKAEAPAAAEV